MSFRDSIQRESPLQSPPAANPHPRFRCDGRWQLPAELFDESTQRFENAVAHKESAMQRGCDDEAEHQHFWIRGSNSVERSRESGAECSASVKSANLRFPEKS
jgi:hypothetical protein